MGAYLDEFPIVRSRHVNADVCDFEHRGIVVAGVMLLQAIVVCCIFVVPHGKSPLTIFFIYFCYSFLCFGHVAHPVGGDVEFYGAFKEFYAFLI